MSTMSLAVTLHGAPDPSSDPTHTHATLPPCKTRLNRFPMPDHSNRNKTPPPQHTHTQKKQSRNKYTHTCNPPPPPAERLHHTYLGTYLFPDHDHPNTPSPPSRNLPTPLQAHHSPDPARGGQNKGPC
ncbi:hypothetical protein BS50DRAFT_217357 [Corynespora cassiicola Philippines]|uniref:Uncharacterized protein n=1 Tax=Corynespora cassiicola Philippines TaxID=1448308 RepID=A0A2T2N434_CORCC|nr:hypothetical protein BS50DRAFT_217357 [Corynespora cassiicola Philippines]